MILSSPIKTLSGPGWLVVVLAAASVSSATEETINAKVGDEVTLKPKEGSVTEAIKSINWKVGLDLAVEYDEGHFKFFREFEGRSNLNNQTGELTITNVTFQFKNDYKTELNGKTMYHTIHLNVFAPVPVPTIARSSCPEDSSTCTLTCEGSTTDETEPVQYIWMADNIEVPGSTDKTYTVKNDSSGVREFSCKMKNPVSEERSKPFSNPFKAPESGPKISRGVTVLIILLSAVILVVIIHRMKTGECFYNKSSMPWERDFWRNTKAQQPQVAASESNGNTTPLKGQLDEETAVMD
ncbi:PREDICTED: T-lymphocyte surface antigen Ly-9-like isoform X2 [Poecilia mexicana]|uniref:T-lymphocyte surface antigen Ly-9-like isoform X2 n=1 Tax=Poecilia mexicana TaxID=48701 RepID=UPI00072E6BD6|nr:PREDICTED: T-lymphocyte surface antigen Ly-9-like isoform X2 [Poecilia mexicana]